MNVVNTANSPALAAAPIATKALIVVSACAVTSLSTYFFREFVGDHVEQAKRQGSIDAVVMASDASRMISAIATLASLVAPCFVISYLREHQPGALLPICAMLTLTNMFQVQMLFE